MSRTALFADGVVRSRSASLDAAGASRMPHKSRPAHAAGAGPLRILSVLVCALTLSVGAFAGTAYALFGTTVSGSARATVGKLAPVVVEQATIVPDSLFPGGSAGLSLKLKNPNNRTLTLIGVVEVGTTVMVTPATSGCTGATAGVSVSSSVASGLSDLLKASSSTGGITDLTLASGAIMSSSAPNACQTKAFHIDVTVRVRT